MYLPSSASFLWHKQWKCSTLQQFYDPGHKRTNNRSHPRSHLWWRAPDHWTAMTACQTAQYFSACCHQNCWRGKKRKRKKEAAYVEEHDLTTLCDMLDTVIRRRGLTWCMNICCCFCYIAVSQWAVKTNFCFVFKKWQISHETKPSKFGKKKKKTYLIRGCNESLLFLGWCHQRYFTKRFVCFFVLKERFFFHWKNKIQYFNILYRTE